MRSGVSIPDSMATRSSVRATSELAYVPVIVEVQGAGLLEGQTTNDLNVEIYAYVTNEVGEMRDFFSQVANFDLAKFREKILFSGVKYYGYLELAPGDYLLRVLVRNAETGRTGVAASPLAVPRYTEAGATLLPPFFMDDPVDKWLLLRYRGEEDDGTSVIYPFTVKGQPFVPAAKPELKAGQPVDFCLMTYNLGAGDPGLEAWVAGADGEEQLGRLSLVERTITGISGFDKLLARFRPQGLATGEYTLFTTSQNPHVIRLLMGAFVLHIPEHKLRVYAPDVGGAFGSKIYHYAEEAIVTWAAGKLHRPVKWTAERSESFMSDCHGRDHITHAELALDKDGKFLGLKVLTKANMGAYLSTFAPCVPTYLYATLLAGVYTTPQIYCEVKAVFTNTVPVDAYRGAGRPEATYLIERLVKKEIDLMINRAERLED